MNTDSTLYKLISETQGRCTLTTQAAAPFTVGQVQAGELEHWMTRLLREAENLEVIALALQQELHAQMDLARKRDRNVRKSNVVSIDRGRAA